jgi:hypothetical protein
MDILYINESDVDHTIEQIYMYAKQNRLNINIVPQFLGKNICVAKFNDSSKFQTIILYQRTLKTGTEGARFQDSKV